MSVCVNEGGYVVGDHTADIVQDCTLKGLHATASKIRIWSSSHIEPDPKPCSAINLKSYQVSAEAGKSRAVKHLQERLLEAASAKMKKKCWKTTHREHQSPPHKKRAYHSILSLLGTRKPGYIPYASWEVRNFLKCGGFYCRDLKGVFWWWQPHP